jgi:hypothetical protein
MNIPSTIANETERMAELVRRQHPPLFPVSKLTSRIFPNTVRTA